MNKCFSRSRSVRDIAVSAGLFVAGVVVVVFPSSVSVNILGAFMCFFGIVTFFMMKSSRVDTQTGIRYKKCVKYFPSSMKADILKALSDDPTHFDWAEKDDSEGIMLEIYYSTAANNVYVHCLQYVPYEYCSCSDWYCFPIDRCGNMIQ